MKIKTKKQLNLPQLIEWAWKNNIENKEFRAKDNYTEVIFGDDGDFSLGQMGFVEEKDTFTVEVEEEITEDTEIPKMVEIYLDNERDIPYSQIHYNQTINRAISTQECGSKTLTFHKLNDDDTLTLIWRNGTLVKGE